MRKKIVCVYMYEYREHACHSTCVWSEDNYGMSLGTELRLSGRPAKKTRVFPPESFPRPTERIFTGAWSQV